MASTIEGGRNLTKRGSGALNKANPAIIERYLRSIHFPVQKKFNEGSPG